MEHDVNHSTDGANQEGTPKTFNVKVGIDANGEPIMQSVTEDELLNGYLRQSDYTRKTQELAEEKKQLQFQAQQAVDHGYKWDTDDDAAVEAYLQSKWYAKKDTVENLVEKKLKAIQKEQQDERTIQDLITANPDLKQFEWAIKKIAATDNSAIEDIVVKYGFSTHDKLSKAKQRGIVWNSNVKNDWQPKSVSEWTKEDWAKFEAQANKSQFR